MFLRNSIERILHDKDTRRKEHAALKKACESAIEQLDTAVEQHTKQQGSSGSILPNLQEYIRADDYFYPFELAVQSKSPKIVVTALDCLQKLIAHGHLVADGPDPGNPDRLLIDRIVEGICGAFIGPFTDDTVQLQVIKVILAIVLSNTTRAHGTSLLLMVRTCFNVYIASKSIVNQATAKGILTQIISAVFLAMERREMQEQNIEFELDEMVVKSVVDSIVNQVVAAEHASEVIVTNGTHRSSAQHSPVVANLSVESLADQMSSPADESLTKLEFKSVEEHDAFLIFRSMCKLAMKDVPSDADKQSIELRSKVLALEMVLVVLQNFHAPLNEKHSLIYAIKHILCFALTKNASSPNVQVFEKALAIFVELVHKFKAHLKKQIEVFFKEIILSMLESPSSPFQHKWIIMNIVLKIVENHQSVVDIYVNYDCHLTSANIFELLVNHLSKVARGAELPVTSQVQLRDREREMRAIGLECLVKVLKCLVTFYDEVATFSKNGELSTKGVDESEDSIELNGVQQYEQLKQQKSIIEHGIDLFTKKPKQGLAFLQEKGFLGKTHNDIARFFHVEERLDKTAIGDYLGDGDEFNKQVMYAYIDQLDFTGFHFVQALRCFLDKFRLPGEAQKIDRLMEKFASRFCECNAGQQLFASADTAYVLSYAIIMLTTDLHNPQVRKKMTKEQFVRSVSGINDQNDLPEDFLSEIFDDIAVNEIKMKPGGHGNKPKLNADVASVSYRQLKQFQNLELQTIAANAHALMEAASIASGEFTSASHYDHVKPMFKMMWTPCLAAFSIGLQSSDDVLIWRICLEGFRYGIRVAAVFRMATQRDAYLQALTRFTLLMAKNSLSEMKSKNVECIKLLITVGVEDGNFLDECWYDVLKCISQLELAQLIGAPLNGHAHDIRHVFNIDERAILQLQECLGEANSQSVVIAVDRIFQGSAHLSGEAIVHFVKALCRVSDEELNFLPSPRMFMLQKIVEISACNMNRIRIEWSLIWNILGRHFNTAGCSPNVDVSHFALDALKQLSLKFLEKGELPNFRLQKEFLRPFEFIMENNEAHSCRDMTIACITNMVQSHGDRIRSGWKNIFVILTLAAAESREDLVDAAFRTVVYIIQEVFPKIFGEVIDSFPEAVKCLSEFACNNHFPDVCMESIRLIRMTANLVRENTELFANESEADHALASTPHNSPQHAALADNEKVWAKGWLSIFIQLWSIISRCKLDVRTRSLTVFFEIIKTHGRDFRPAWWGDVFNIIFKVFKFSSLAPNEKNEWMTTTCNHALFAIVDVVSEHFTQLAPHVPAFYEQLLLCVEHGSEELARASIDVLANLIISNGQNFTSDMWEQTIALIQKIFEISEPDFPTDDDVSPQTANSVTDSSASGETMAVEGPSSTLPTPERIVLPPGADEDSVLASSITRCLIRQETVDAISCILFGKDAFRVESPSSTGGRQRYVDVHTPDNGNSYDWPEQVPMYPFVSAEHMAVLTDLLLKSHHLARTYTNSATQRILWRAALKGKKKPNFTRIETHTMHCALNILFHSYADSRFPSTLTDKFRQQLLDTVNTALNEYIAIRSEQYRTPWLAVIQLLLNRTFDLPDDRFTHLGIGYYVRLADLIEAEEQLILRTSLRRVIIRAMQIPNLADTRPTRSTEA